jgi:5-formyltetrahydrofolate cyclo-ligase
MSSEAGMSKRELREKIRTTLKGMREAERRAGSETARRLLEEQRAWKRARSVLFYAPMAEELDVWPLFEDTAREGKNVFLPRFAGEGEGFYAACAVKDPKNELRRGQFGIREPVESCPEIPLMRLDLVLVPGIAFDLQGRRLGRGKGYYDRLLAEVRGITCGVAFDEQIVAELPVEPHDIYVNCILTPTRWIEL